MDSTPTYKEAIFTHPDVVLMTFLFCGLKKKSQACPCPYKGSKEQSSSNFEEKDANISQIDPIQSIQKVHIYL